MRALLAAAVLLLPVAAAGAQAPPAGERYTPSGIWRDAWEARFYERWHGNQLRAMDEPVLARRGDLGRFRSRFRLLVLPNSEPAWTIRIDERSTGDGIVTFVVLDGAGGYAPGNVARRHRSTIDRNDMAALRSELGRVRFAELPPQQPPRSNECVPVADDGSDEEDGSDCVITICIHATQFVVERLDRNGRHYLERDSCAMEQWLIGLFELVQPLRERD